jgi:hypothetical protein
LDDVRTIAESAGVELIHRGALDLIQPADMPLMLQTAARLNFRILGIEGFFLLGDQVAPDTCAILDLSNEDNIAAGAAAAEAFVSQTRRPDNYYYEITL